MSYIFITVVVVCTVATCALGAVCYSFEKFSLLTRIAAAAFVGLIIGLIEYAAATDATDLRSYLVPSVAGTVGMGFVVRTLYREFVLKVPKDTLPSDSTMVLICSITALVGASFIK